MKRTKITKIKARPEYQQQQRFIRYVGACDFYWRFTRLVGALEMLAAEPPSDDEDYSAVIGVLADVAERIRGQFGKVLEETYTAEPGERLLKAESSMKLCACGNEIR